MLHCHLLSQNGNLAVSSESLRGNTEAEDIKIYVSKLYYLSSPEQNITE